MNALADPSTVKGDFSGEAILNYRGGIAHFYRQGEEYRMRLNRDDVTRIYRISQTIGSRFYQYYVGTLISGSGSQSGARSEIDHVLPFGYWLDEKQWVPVVHVHEARQGNVVDYDDNLPSEVRADPFSKLTTSLPDFTPYFFCNHCHTTFPLGDQLVRNAHTVGRHLPIELHVDVLQYLHEAHPVIGEQVAAAIMSPNPAQPIEFLRRDMKSLDAREHAVNLGISCEACHLGSREHAKGILKKPYFFARSKHLYIGANSEMSFGRTHQNMNWMCSRCHTGSRPLLAGGMATWNSTEYTDATRGSCYSQLNCVDCHNPHKATGPKWELSPDHDDRLCLKCHQQFQSADSRKAHTHHPAGTAGDRCMNCHMPRINEGLQDVVRTHMIFSPTNREMIEANHPNACNQCHVKDSIKWTQKHLKEWYGSTYDPNAIARNYPNLKTSVVLGWLASDNHSVRLIAADVLGRTNSRWALKHLIDALDDPMLLNRQFAGRSLESMMGIRLDEFGYRFFMGRDERSIHLERIRQSLLPVEPIQELDSRESPTRSPTNTPTSDHSAKY
jgi:predicted CXXCH cytochrome family protein